jgi:hypothetical protein
LLEDAVTSELVSEAKFPANWENTGNLVDFGSTIGIFRPKAPLQSMPYGKIPGATEQGIKWAAAGN